MIEEVLRDLAPGREPDLVVAGDVGERLLEGRDTIGLADQVRMQRDAHHRAGIRALLVEPVELALDDVAIGARRSKVDVEDDGVVHLQRIGDAH